MNSRRATLVALTFSLTACSRPAPVFASTDITGVPWGHDFRLTDPEGHTRALSDFRGKVVMLYFGYTHCPDMCPTVLSDMAQVRARIGADAQRVQGLFVTVDPARDTPQIIAQYAPAFDPSFLGLRGDAKTTAAVAADYKVYFAPQQTDAQGHYTVDHSGGIYVFDPQGRLRLLMRSGMAIDAMAADVAQLLKGA